MNDLGPEPPPPEEEYAPIVVPLHGGRMKIDGITNSLDSIRRLLQNEAHRKLVTGSADPLRLNDLTGQITQGNIVIDCDSLSTTIRMRAERFIHYETKGQLQPDGTPAMAALKLAKLDTKDAIFHAAEQDRYHPVREYLDTVKAIDHGGSAINHVASDCLGLSEPLDQRILKLWAISCVARAMRPGCQVDTVLVLVGGQELGKTSFFRIMAGSGPTGEKFYGNTRMDLERKTENALMQLHSRWIYEWGELASIRQAQVEDVKNFISSPSDVFKMPYARTVSEHLRHTVIVGSTNTVGFLRDATGERRFWPVEITGSIPLDKLSDARDDFWAEALARYEAGEAWHFAKSDPDAQLFSARLSERHEKHREADDWEEPVRQWLSSWVREVTTALALECGLKMQARDIEDRHSKRMARVLRALDYRPILARIEGTVTRTWKRNEKDQ
jgi:predicted P-loop ATPase